MTNSNKLNMTWPITFMNDMTHVAQLVGFVESCSGSQCHHDVDFLDLVSHPYLEWLNAWSLTVFVDILANRNLDAAWEVYKVGQCIV